MRKLLSVKNDFVFKRLFGEEGCEEILKPFLEVVLSEQIDSIEISRDRELIKNIEDEKTGIIDVKAIYNNATKVNIEIQIQNGYNMNKRSFFYLSKLYVEGFKKGQDYKELIKTISINILGYNQFNKDHCHSVFKLKDEENSTRFFNDVLEIHFLELLKVSMDNIENETLLDWLKFIKTDNDEVVKALSEKNKDIYKASKKLEELSSDEEIRSLAENRAKYLSDYNTNMRGSFEEGIEKGIEQGEIKALKKTLIKMINRLDANEEANVLIIGAIEKLEELSILSLIEDYLLDGNLDEVKKLLKL